MSIALIYQIQNDFKNIQEHMRWRFSNIMIWIFNNSQKQNCTHKSQTQMHNVSKK